MNITNIIFTGVGGQGIILSSRLIAQCAFVSGNDVKVNEVHGMAQRGGSVLSHLRFGDRVYSPLVPKGNADYLVAMEELEGLRYISYLRPGARVILNTRKIMPNSLINDEKSYPADIKHQFLNNGFTVDEISAYDIAKTIGNIKVENIILAGVLSKYLPFPELVWEQTIKQSVPDKTLELNLAAFKKGRESKN
jgi:indolepyruvate ferredoxin oxidoreductase beta subunit